MFGKVFGNKIGRTNDSNGQSAGSLDLACPLFVIGCPRSGTTLMAKVLNSHPLVLMTNETAVFLLLNENITKSRQGVPAGLLYGKEYNNLWADHLAERAKSLIETYYEKIIRAEGKTGVLYWGEKHPHNFECLSFISSLYSDARYVYIVRDPRDSACSVRALIGTGHTSAIEGLKFTADVYEDFCAQLPDNRVIRVRYEDLIADYHGEFGHIFKWLGLRQATEVEQFIDWQKNVDAHGILPPSPLIDFHAQSVGRWHREFSEAEKHYAGELLADYLDRHGYVR